MFQFNVVTTLDTLHSCDTNPVCSGGAIANGYSEACFPFGDLLPLENVAAIGS